MTTRSDGMSESDFYNKWSEVIKNTPMRTREPMWDQAIKHLISEGAMEPTMGNELSQGWIQSIILDGHYIGNILDLFQEFGRWVGEEVFKNVKFPLAKGNEYWLAYLMAVYYAMEWDGEKWVDIG